MRQQSGDWETEMRREAALALVLLGMVWVGLLTAMAGVLVDDFVLGFALAVVPGVGAVAGFWLWLLR